jgi:hypothetical protein
VRVHAIMAGELPLQHLDTVQIIPRKPVPTTTATASSSNSLDTQYKTVAQQEKLEPERVKVRRGVKWPQSAWISESAFLLFAIANLAATVILLVLRQDKPLPKWPSVLGINALVSIFSSLFKIGLLFCVTECISELKWLWFDQPNALSDFARYDSASRGTWGALKLIIKRPLNLVSTLGAAITIIAIGVDPFTQQVLRFYVCTIPHNLQTASVPRINNYTIGESSSSSSGAMIDPKLTGALYQGMLNPFTNATAAVSTYCPSGSCTFTHIDNVAYSSLAMCSSVKDITTSVRGSGILGPSMDETGTWNYYLPSGLIITSPYALATAGVSPTNTGLGYQSLFEFEILATSTNCLDGYNYSDVKYYNASGHCVMKPFAANASVTPCVLTYGNVRVADSTFKEKVRSRSMLPWAGSAFSSVANQSSIPGIDCTGSRTLHGRKTVPTGMNGNITSGEGVARSADYEQFIVSGQWWDILYYDPACVFNFEGGPAGGLNAALREFFGEPGFPQ